MGKRVWFQSAVMKLRLFLVAALLLAVLAALRGADPGPVAGLRELYFDTLQRAAPRQALDLPVRIVDIDEESLGELGQWPWPRDKIAEMTNALAELGAAVIVFDVLFAEPDRLSAARLLEETELFETIEGTELFDRLASLDNDTVFANALAATQTVLGIADAGEGGRPPPPPRAGFAQIGDAPAGSLFEMRSATRIVPVLEDAATGLGNINVSPVAEDSVVREVPLVWQGVNGGISSLAVEALRLALGESTLVLFGVPGTEGMSSLGVGPFDVPTTSKGQMRVYYRPDSTIDYVSAATLFDPSAFANVLPLIEGHIVFVGTSAAGLLDIRATPLGERVPGVSIHAQIVEQILSETYLVRSDITAGIEIMSLIALGIVVAAAMAFAGPVAGVLSGGVAALGLATAGWFAFERGGILFDITFPLFGGFVVFGSLAAFQYIVSDRERRLIRRSFSKYVSGDILNEIERAGHRLTLGGESRDVTVMFSDIRNFTPLSETMPPQELVSLLNSLFTDLTEDILSEKGTIDKYIGDSIMAFWNAPLELDGHRRAACLAALKMRATLAAFNAPRAEAGLTTIGVSIGLAAGTASVGNIGSAARYNYSVIGDTVNVAARIESTTRHAAYDILVTEDVAKAAPDLAFLPAGYLSLKGVTNRAQTFILVGGADLASMDVFQELYSAHTRLTEAFATGIAADEPLAHCQATARRIGHGLPEFYECIAERHNDFKPN